LISHQIVAAARKFKAEGYETLPKILACDSARFGDDRTVIGIRQGRRFRICAKLRGVDTVQTAHKIIEIIKAENPVAGWVVDGDGIGAGVCDQLQYLGYGEGNGLFEFHGGARAFDSNKYFNRRAEVWGLAAAWLPTAQIDDDPELEVDLCGPQYGFSNKNQIQLEKKDDMKARGLASPDCGDVLAMTFAAPHLLVSLRSLDDWDDLARRSRSWPLPPSEGAWMA